MSSKNDHSLEDRTPLIISGLLGWWQEVKVSMHFRYSLLTPESIKIIRHTLSKKDENLYFTSLNQVINYFLWKQTDNWLLQVFLHHTNNATKCLTWITVLWSELQAEVWLDYFQRNPSKQALGWTTNVRVVPLDSSKPKIMFLGSSIEHEDCTETCKMVYPDSTDRSDSRAGILVAAWDRGVSCCPPWATKNVCAIAKSWAP